MRNNLQKKAQKQTELPLGARVERDAFLSNTFVFDKSGQSGRSVISLYIDSYSGCIVDFGFETRLAAS